MYKVFLKVNYNSFLIFLIFFIKCKISIANSCDKNSDTFQCLLCNCFYEAGGESFAGQEAILKSTISRLKVSKYPDSICGIVYQSNQYSWVSDKKANFQVPESHNCWSIAKKYNSMNFENIPFYGEMFYNPNKAQPKWAKYCVEVETIGRHRFMDCREADAKVAKELNNKKPKTKKASIKASKKGNQ